MDKWLILQKVRAAAALIILLSPGLAEAATVQGCITSEEQTVACNAPNALLCYETPYSGGTDQTGCNAIGFAIYAGGGEWGEHSGDDLLDVWFCAGGLPGCGIAAVPELEEYAAATFLVIALTIGWQMRRRYCPAA